MGEMYLTEQSSDEKRTDHVTWTSKYQPIRGQNSDPSKSTPEINQHHMFYSNNLFVETNYMNASSSEESFCCHSLLITPNNTETNISNNESDMQVDNHILVLSNPDEND